MPPRCQFKVKDTSEKEAGEKCGNDLGAGQPISAKVVLEKKDRRKVNLLNEKILTSCRTADRSIGEYWRRRNLS